MPRPDINGKRTSSSRPIIVNRGPAGLLRKLPVGIELTKVFTASIGDIDRFADDLLPLLWDINVFVLDPMNARMHPERNLEAVRESLRQYGQKKPIVVRRQTMVVVAGNGTLEAARSLGWTKLAAVVQDMTDVEAAGYGIADNRTAELACWNEVNVRIIDKMLQESGSPTIGWSVDELTALRLKDFIEPPKTIVSDKTNNCVCPKCGHCFTNDVNEGDDN